MSRVSLPNLARPQSAPTFPALTAVLRRRQKSKVLAASAIAVALVLGTALPAAADTIGGSKSCSSTQQYGVTTTLSSEGAPTSTTPTLHTYPTGSVYRYGTGAKSSYNVGVSSGTWEAYVPSQYGFFSWSGICGIKAT